MSKKSKSEINNGAESGSSPSSCSSPGYAKGYAAGIRRVEKLKLEIAALKAAKTPEPGNAETVEYLLKSAEALTRAAEILLEAKKQISETNVKVDTRDLSRCRPTPCSVSDFDSSLISEEELIRQNSESVESLLASQFLVDVPHDGSPSKRAEERGPTFGANKFMGFAGSPDGNNGSGELGVVGALLKPSDDGVLVLGTFEAEGWVEGNDDQINPLLPDVRNLEFIHDSPLSEISSPNVLEIPAR